MWSSSYQFREKLQRCGEWHSPEEIGDVLLALAREKLPESPGACWDSQWASRLSRESLERLAGHYAALGEDERSRLNLEAQDAHEEAINRAGEENDPAAFRLALAEWERAGYEAFDSARSRNPVAS